MSRPSAPMILPRVGERFKLRLLLKLAVRVHCALHWQLLKPACAGMATGRCCAPAGSGRAAFAAHPRHNGPVTSNIVTTTGSELVWIFKLLVA